MADITIYGPRPYFAAKLKKAVADDTVVESITTAGARLSRLAPSKKFCRQLPIWLTLRNHQGRGFVCSSGLFVRSLLWLT